MRREVSRAPGSGAVAEDLGNNCTEDGKVRELTSQPPLRALGKQALKDAYL